MAIYSSVKLGVHDHLIVRTLLSLLEERDTSLRMEVLSAVKGHLGPADADLVPFLLLAAKDPSFTVREDAMVCLGRMGRSASNALPTVQQLCSDSDVDVQIEAGWALWNLTGQTNMAVPVLENALSRNTIEWRREFTGYYLREMGCRVTNSP
jgi:HEAT repeat protein